MKKLIVGLMVAAFAIVAQAEMRTYSFLSCDALSLTNGALGWTNLMSVVHTNAGGTRITTNFVGLKYTNSAGTLVTIAAGNKDQLFVDVPLPSIGVFVAPTNPAIASYSNYFGTLTLSMCSEANATGSVIVCISKLPDGINEMTTAGKEFDFGITAGIPFTSTLHLASEDWVGCKAIRLRYIRTATDVPTLSRKWVKAINFTADYR